MSMNPFYLELMAKQRQAELLALARPQQIAVPLGRRQPLGGRLRAALAQLMIRIGWRLDPGGGQTLCHYPHRGGLLANRAAEGFCNCPARGAFSECPPLQCG